MAEFLKFETSSNDFVLINVEQIVSVEATNDGGSLVRTTSPRDDGHVSYFLKASLEKLSGVLP